MVEFYQKCSSSFDIPSDSWLYELLTELSKLNGYIFISICIFIGPIIIILNVFVMFILTRKELRSCYNFVFFLMALDQTFVIGILTIQMYKNLFFFACTPAIFSMFWMLFDLIAVQQMIGICKAHATWLAVIIAFMRLMSIRNKGCSELQFKLVAILCGGALVFVLIANTPNFFSYMIIWISFEALCVTKEYGDLVIPYSLESPIVYENDCMILKLISFLSGIFHSALPCTLLIVFSVILLIFLKKVRIEREVMNLQKGSRESLDQDRTTTLLMCILITILSLLEGFLSSKMRVQVTSNIGNLILSLMLLTSAANLLIYLFMSRKFREVAKSYVCFPCRKILKLASSQQSSAN